MVTGSNRCKPVTHPPSTRAPYLLAFGSAPSTGMPSFSAERSKTSERPKTSCTQVGYG